MINSLLIKPAGPDCNMNCTYCFYKCKSQMFNDSVHRMSNDTMNNIIEKFLSQGKGNYSIVFQGGEPTLCGIDFFKNFVEKVNEVILPGQNIHYSIQTNGLLLDEEFCVFLKDNNFLVGLSFDGTEEINDYFRVDYSGKGTSKNVLNAVNLLKKYGIEFNILCVITNKNAGKGKEIYSFLKKNGCDYMQFIPCLEIDENGKVRDFCMTSKEYGKFLCDTFDLWYNGGKPDTYVRFFEETLISYVTYKGVNCSYMPSCAVAPVIEYNGDIFPCDFFVENSNYMGNINTIDFSDLEKNPDLLEFKLVKWKYVNEDCKKCKWKGLCFGDCRKNRIGIENKSYFCEGYKMFFEYSHEKFISLKKDILNSKKYIYDFESSLNRNDSCPCGSGYKFKNCCMDIKKV